MSRLPIDDILSPLGEYGTQALIGDSVQVADLLLWILRQTGPASVRISSFSVAEEFLRRIFFMQRDGLITGLDIILDFKATHKTLILWPFIEQVVQRCHLASNHSKVILVSNREWHVSVVTSQNLTRGNRYEASCISTERRIFDTLSSKFNDIVKSHSVPFHDVFRARTNAD